MIIRRSIMQKKLFILIIFSFYTFILSTFIFSQDRNALVDRDTKAIEQKEKKVQEDNSPKEPKKNVSKDSSSDNVIFNLGILAGVDVLDFIQEKNRTEIYQTIGLKPKLKIGNFGFGLNLQLHYRFTDDEDSFIEILSEEWVPDSDAGLSFLDIYLPKIDYIVWGEDGDSFFVNIDQIYGKTLGTGSLINNYSNNLFQTNQKILGLDFGVDGQLFNFPYIGIEGMVGNLARFDVFGVRLYARPFYWLEVPVIKNIEIGGSTAADLNPDIRSEFYDTEKNNGKEAEMIIMYNGDLIVPILNKNYLSLALSGNFCYQNGHLGGDAGIGGRIVSIIPFLFQLRIYDDNFIPSFFDYSYDIKRGEKYDIYNLTDGTVAVDKGLGWLAGTGVALFDDKINLRILLDGPFSTLATNNEMNNENINYLDYMHLHVNLYLMEGLIPNFSSIIRYDKLYINEFLDFLMTDYSTFDLVLCYATDLADLYFEYKWCYFADDESEITRYDYEISTSIYCTFNLF